MSAHRIYCYAPQRRMVEDFLRDALGVVISRDCPHPVDSVEQLTGLDHITFATFDNHPEPVPQPMWEHITRQGAMVMHIDEQYQRAARVPRVNVTHYGAESVESPRPATD